MKKRIFTGLMAVAVSLSMSGALVGVTAFAAGSAAMTAQESRITGGSYDASSAVGIVIDDSESGHNGILIIDSDYTINDATIKMNTDADGSDTCDFSGKGTAVAVFGNSDVVIENSSIETTGVATMPIFNDTGSTVTVKDSTLKSNGGTIYSDYLNTAAQNVMISPPWILGIMGDARCTNLEGDNSTLNVFDSETSSGAWAVLSTDSGSNMYLNAYNTSLTLNNKDESQIPIQADGGQVETKDNPYTTNYGAGYGTYAIGAAVETFAGATLNVGTYATIFTGGSATLMGIESGQTYAVNQADGSTKDYVASETKNTVVNSDTFGFMFHQGENTLTIENGTEINSGYTTFLMKSGSSNETANVTVDGAKISNGGVLIQVMDNDDATNPDPDMGVEGYGGPVFATVHTENAGFNTAQASQDEASQNFAFTNGEYSGNIYNASGSDASTVKSLNGSPLNVTLGNGAVLNGAAASTAAIHVTYDGSQYVKDTNKGFAATSQAEADELLAYQNTEYTISEYFDQGHVANLINDNGANDINMTLTDDAVWNVTGVSLIDPLSISGDAKVVVGDGATLTVGTKQYAAGTVLTAENLDTAAAETVEEVVEKPAEEGGEAGGMMGGPGGPGGGPGGPGGGPGGPGGEAAATPDGCIGSWTGGDAEDYAYDAALTIDGRSAQPAVEEPSSAPAATGAEQKTGGSGWILWVIIILVVIAIIVIICSVAMKKKNEAAKAAAGNDSEEAAASEDGAESETESEDGAVTAAESEDEAETVGESEDTAETAAVSEDEAETAATSEDDSDTNNEA